MTTAVTTLRIRSGAALWIVIAAAGCGAVEPQGTETSNSQSAAGAVSVTLPLDHDVSSQTSFRCRALLETDVTGSTDAQRPRSLEGKIGPGSDDISVSIERPDTLSFLSGAAFAAGTTRGSEFAIQSNTRTELVASHFDGQSSNSFVLNKSNGLAIWSKVRSTFVGYGAPTGASTYLSCE